MEIKTSTSEYLEKTYCHLKNVVLPNNQENWNKFPISKSPDGPVAWERIRDEIVDTMKAIENELNSRGTNIPSC